MSFQKSASPFPFSFAQESEGRERERGGGKKNHNKINGSRNLRREGTKASLCNNLLLLEGEVEIALPSTAVSHGKKRRETQSFTVSLAR